MNNNELSFIKDMFDKIAPRYDIINRILSLRQDVYWRSKMISEIKNPNKINVLDVACGTGDVIIELINQKGARINVIGVDFSKNMLSLAKKKMNKKKYGNVSLIAADALYLPFRNNSFDVITIAFGIRNIQNRIKVLKKFHSLLKLGGVLCILELSIPKKTIVSSFFNHYFKKLLPKIGSFFSRNSFAYFYLPESVSNFPNSSDFILTMNRAGFSKIFYKKLSMGIANLFLGYRV